LVARFVNIGGIGDLIKKYRYVLWCSLRIPHEHVVRFVSTSSFLLEGSCLIYVICICLRVMVSNIYCVMFLLCFSSSSVPYDIRFSGLSIFDCPFGILYRLFDITVSY